jgi:hypothetical protein
MGFVDPSHLGRFFESLKAGRIGMMEDEPVLYRWTFWK